MLESEFKALASQGYNRIPMVAECLADLDTPLSIYRKLADCPDSFLLESVVGGERFGRYSFIGLPAKRRIEVRIGENGPETIVKEAGKTVETLEGNPLDAIEAYLGRIRVAPPSRASAVFGRTCRIPWLRHDPPDREKTREAEEGRSRSSRYSSPADRGNRGGR